MKKETALSGSVQEKNGKLYAVIGHGDPITKKRKYKWIEYYTGCEKIRREGGTAGCDCRLYGAIRKGMSRHPFPRGLSLP